MEVISRLRAVLRELVPGGERQYERQLPPGDPRRTDSLVDGVDDGDDLVASLVDGGVLVQQGEGLVLSTGFETGWQEEMDTLAAMDEGAFADAVAAAAPGVEHAVVVDDQGRQFVVVHRGREDQLWVSRPVALAEVAAIRSLPETVPPELRLAGARPLRLFLEDCPDCGGSVTTVDGDDWPAVNRGDEDPDQLLVCLGCGERLYTY